MLVWGREEDLFYGKGDYNDNSVIILWNGFIVL